MLTQKRTVSRRARRGWRFHDDRARSPVALGCFSCPDFDLCGGLHAESGAFDCRSYCCGNPANCDMVCDRHSCFVDRVREVDGFRLETISRTPRLTFPPLLPSVPLIFHRGSRLLPFAPPFVALSLYEIISRSNGEPRFRSKTELCERFGISDTCQILLSGTDVDQPLERWWAVGHQRENIVRRLIDLGAVAATTPNYSVFSNVPRWDNLHSMKRIALVWQEMTNAGLPTALHVNARTLRDWERWTDFVRTRPEVTGIAYEFGTGAIGRIRWHVEELCNMAQAVNRPLTLVVRGGLNALADLRQAFTRVIFIDTTSMMKTLNRRRAVIGSSGRLRWEKAPTSPQLALDELLEHNYLTFARAIGE